MTDFIAALADLILPELMGGYAPEYVVDGINFILENDYKINSLFTAGGKIYLGMFERSDLTYGAILHFGIAP